MFFRVFESPTPKKPRPKKKGAEGESKEDESKPKYIHDGKLLFAVTQLTVKLCHLNPRRKRDQKKIMLKAPKTTNEDLEVFQNAPDDRNDGRERPGGGSLGVSGPSRIERDARILNPAHRAGGPALRRERGIRTGAS